MLLLLLLLLLLFPVVYSIGEPPLGDCAEGGWGPTHTLEGTAGDPGGGGWWYL